MKLTQKNIIKKKWGGSGRIFKGVKHLVCLECDKKFPLNTKRKFYLLNAHGWGYCAKCMKRTQTNAK